MRISIQAASLALAALGLAGCSSLGGRDQIALSDADQVDVDRIFHEYSLEQLENGRKLMRAGAFATAIDPLRRATRDPQTAPAAYNAIGVAYAQLDRQDIAKRFFQLAVLLDPENRSFAANLLRLNTKVPGKADQEEKMLAQADESMTKDPMSGNPPAVTDANTAKTTKEPVVAMTVAPAFGKTLNASSGTGSMSRLSAYEVRVGGPRHAPRGERRQLVSSGYPIRIKIEERNGAASDRSSNSKAYPQRIEF